MKRMETHYIPPNGVTFFSVRDSTNKPKPRYLFCTENDKNNPLSVFITTSIENFWIKRGLNDWQELKIKHLLKPKEENSTIYFFEKNDYMDSLNISIVKNKAYALKETLEIPLDTIHLSQEALHKRGIPNLSLLDLTSIPETREEVQKKLDLDEKRQEIQKVENIIILLGKTIENILNLKYPPIESVNRLSDQINIYKEQKILYAKQLQALENPIEEQTEGGTIHSFCVKAV